jgi:hypothetical protein
MDENVGALSGSSSTYEQPNSQRLACNSFIINEIDKAPLNLRESYLIGLAAQSSVRACQLFPLISSDRKRVLTPV